MNTNKKLNIILLAIVFIFGTQCSTKKNTALTRGFHKLTSKYNIYFNGYESYKKGMAKINASIEDDFTNFLPIFAYENQAAAESAKGDMDRAIKKGQKVIALHSITAKPKPKKGKKSKKQKAFYKKNEYNEYADDAYFLIAKAKFMQHDFEGSMKSLQFIQREFAKEEASFIANIWLAKNNIALNKLEDAKTDFSKVGNVEKYSRQVKKEYYLTYADLFAHEENYKEAAIKLKKSLEFVRNKKDRARYAYILAQYYQEMKKYKEAAFYYDLVIRKSPNYELSFSARINRATNSDLGNQGKEMKKELNKLLNDDKNKEYKDQIYFALGQIAEREAKTAIAIDYYNKSINHSIDNNRQKVKTFLALARLHLAKESYVPAYRAYDSVMTFIDTDYPQYAQISKVASRMIKLGRSLEIIEVEDSLQRLANMDSDDRLAIIDAKIQEIKDKEEEQRLAIQEGRENLMYNQNAMRNSSSAGNTGKWYFYNISSKSFGETDFKRKWGDRKLSDHWRRKNKSIVNFDMMDEEESEDSLTVVDANRVKDNKTREFYLQDIPTDEAALKKSNKRIERAMFKVAESYRNDFEDADRAIDSYEKLNKRFPENSNLVTVYYYLYQLSKQQGNQSKANFYKNKLVNNFGDSKFAKAITDPNFIAREKAKIKAVEDYYQKTFSYYQLGDYPMAQSRIIKAKVLYADDKAKMAKYALLEALIVGQTKDDDQFKKALETVVSTYSSTPEAKYAQDMIPRIESTQMEALVAQQEEAKKQQEEQNQQDAKGDSGSLSTDIFTYKEDAVHYFVLVGKTKDINFNQLNFNIINFNIYRNPYSGFSANVMPLNDEYSFILVQALENKEDAMIYRETLMKDQKTFADFQNIPFISFVISEDNYGTFKADKSVPRYVNFFKEYYEK